MMQQAPIFQPPPNYPPPQPFHAAPPGYTPQAFPAGFQPALPMPPAQAFQAPPPPPAGVNPQPAQPGQHSGSSPQTIPQQSFHPERPRLPPPPHGAQLTGLRHNVVPPQRGRNRFAPYDREKNER